ncbi:hypothetical protein VP1G_03908 [Cytospora mali]|uniref:Aflatoxin regulatory protein domain-containing protein n=1 Tax=Cytospora mali TaxID=578113 RepID=A0A194UXU5_CYTMA|nr:hypothetical protein VP1G_03908 [Valsa mali var. pyri (nom. inval.)]
MSANISLDLAHDFGSISAADDYLGDSDLLLSPHIDSSCLDTASDSYFDTGLNNAFAEQHNAREHTGSLKESSVFSAQVSAELSQPSYSNSPVTLDSACHDSGYATGSTSPFSREIPLFSPRGSTSSGHASRLSTSASTRSQRIDQCSCLQQQAQLVYRLDDLKQSHDQNTTIDSVLQGVHLAHEPWQNLMRCSRCQSQAEQKEVFLLFAMSIRTLLSLLRKSNLSSVGVSVGSYELSGKFKAKVMDQLSREALQSITTALRYLQEHTGRPRHLPAAELGSNHGAWEQANGMLFGGSNEPQMQFRHQAVPSNLGADGVASLLDTLQCTMQAMGQDLKGSL